MALIANVPNNERNNRNFPFSNTTDHNLAAHNGERGKISGSAYMNHETKDRNWLTAGAEIKISIVAHRFAKE